MVQVSIAPAGPFLGGEWTEQEVWSTRPFACGKPLTHSHQRSDVSREIPWRRAAALLIYIGARPDTVRPTKG
jgi:hypothetical protein